MKKLIVVLITFILLINSSAIAESFLFRDHIRWGTNSDVVQLYEGTSKLHKEKMYSWLKYHDVRVGNTLMSLEYDFVGDKLCMITYTTEKTYTEKEKDQLLELFDSLFKSYQKKYGDKTYTVDELSDIFAKSYKYVMNEDLSPNDVKAIIENAGPSTYNVKLNDTAIYFMITGETTKKGETAKLNIIYVDYKTIAADEDMTGI